MISKSSETLGRRIARMRLQHGMTQERLADIANVSAQAVSKWENDQSYPDILLLPLLAKTFGVTVDELLGAASTEPEPVAAPVEEEPVVEAVVLDEPQPEVDAVEKTAPLPVPEPEGEMEPEPEAAPGPEPAAEEASDVESSATHIRLHVVRGGRDAVNLAIPLAAARLVANVATYIPDRIIEGVDLLGFTREIQSAGRGTLVDVDDGNDRVVITLE